jgi:endonuclease/exonuclease/phosphatase (EEP) superfamily protein YafD
MVERPTQAWTTGRVVRTVLVVGAWLAVAVMAGFAALRLLGLTDRYARLFAAATLTLWVLLPAYAVVVLAAVLRAKALLAAAVVLIGLHVWWVGPDVRWWPRADTATPTAEPFVVASANIYVQNRSDEEATATLAEIDADVLAVVELTPQARSVLDGEGLVDRYPHHIEDPQRGGFGSAIYSKFPILDSEVLDLQGATMSRASIDAPGGPVTVVAVHTLQPLNGLGPIRGQLELLGDVAERSGEPVIFAGDFNATRQHAAFRGLLERGLHDAHLERGRGLATSWPVNRRVPPFALIDHIVMSPELATLDVRELDVPGSDHRAVVATLARRTD